MNIKANHTVLIFIFLIIILGCTSNHYKRTKVGTLTGKLQVQWVEPDKFLFVPDKENPLTFIRHNNQSITPGTMYTDGGSIPRPLWAIKNYSPWGYAPAFIVHDWLFKMKRCNIAGNEAYDVHVAAQIMSEVIKTLMAKNENIKENQFVLYSMHRAVSSKVAENWWHNGKCEQPASNKLKNDEILPSKPLLEYTIEFP